MERMATKTVDKIKTPALMGPAFLFLIAFFFVPLGYLFFLSVDFSKLDFAKYLQILKVDAYKRVFLNSIRISFLVSLVSVVVAYPTAAFISSKSRNVRRWFLLAVTIPFWMSILVRSFAWQVLLQKSGAINFVLKSLGFVNEPVQLSYSLFATVCGMTYIMVPFSILILMATMTKIDKNIMTVARTLGGNDWLVFSKVYFPQTRKSLAISIGLVFALSMGYFITPALLGGPRETMIAMMIDSEMNQVLDFRIASAMAISLIILLGFAFVLASTITRIVWGEDD